MRTRNILLMHSSRSIRAMIKKCILADLGDVLIVETGDGKDALLELSNHVFDIVICNSDLVDMPIAEFKQKAKEVSSKGGVIDFIVLAGPDDDKDRLAGANFDHIIDLPFNARSFIETINQICNPREWRKAKRYHIPNSKAIINVWGMEAEATMINISRGGVLIEVSGDRSELLLQNNPSLTLKINVKGDYNYIKGLPAKLARLNATEWNKDRKPTVMRVAYIFSDLKQDAVTELEQVLDLADKADLSTDQE